MRNLRQLRPTSDRQIEYYGKGLPYLDETRIKGRLIVIEGPDASGRSTQIIKIIPALRSGYIVLADRYIYTLMARDTVRGISIRWSHNLFGFSIKPDLVFY